MSRPTSLVALLGMALCCLAGFAPPARADEEAPKAAGRVLPPVLHPGCMDLLPLDDLQRAQFQRENRILVTRVQALERRVQKLAKGLEARTDKTKKKRKPKQDAEVRKLQTEHRRLRAQVAALMVRVTEKLAPYGVDGPLIAYMNKARKGSRRIDRYGQGLVLLLPDLSPPQRALFERVSAQVDGAADALDAQKERMLLALKQSRLNGREVNALGKTFARQMRVIDTRFWQLADMTLTTEQRAWVWRRLPQRLRRKSQPVEHLYALPGLTPSQGMRLKALFTEIEHETSPDSATVKRLVTATRDRKLSGKERAAAVKERAAAYERLGELHRFAAQATRKILNEEQWLAYEAIPPMVSVNDRRLGFRRLFEGLAPEPAQQARMRTLQREATLKQREINIQRRDIQRKGGDYGPDSPQMMSMQMEMAGVAAAGQRLQREILGRILLEVLRPDQVSRWVMGHYGYKR